MDGNRSRRRRMSVQTIFTAASCGGLFKHGPTWSSRPSRGLCACRPRQWLRTCMENRRHSKKARLKIPVTSQCNAFKDPTSVSLTALWKLNCVLLFWLKARPRRCLKSLALQKRIAGISILSTKNLRWVKAIAMGPGFCPPRMFRDSFVSKCFKLKWILSSKTAFRMRPLNHAHPTIAMQLRMFCRAFIPIFQMFARLFWTPVLFASNAKSNRSNKFKTSSSHFWLQFLCLLFFYLCDLSIVQANRVFLFRQSLTCPCTLQRTNRSRHSVRRFSRKLLMPHLPKIWVKASTCYRKWIRESLLFSTKALSVPVSPMPLLRLLTRSIQVRSDRVSFASRMLEPLLERCLAIPARRSGPAFKV